MLDLEPLRRRASVLRNLDDEDPYVRHVYEIEDNPAGYREVELEAPRVLTGCPIESRVYVADHCLFATVPPCEGELMVAEAEAIASAGAGMLALIAEVERLRADRAAVLAELRAMLDHAREKESALRAAEARTLWIGRSIGLKCAIEAIDPAGTGTVEAS